MGNSAIFDIRPCVASERICRLQVTGELDTVAAPRLLSSLRQVRQGTRLYLDLSGVTFIDCSGLTALLTAVTNARRNGCELEVDEPVSLPVQRMVEMAGVDRLLWP
jgi:anti-sigma B factor antagonist